MRIKFYANSGDRWNTCKECKEEINYSSIEIKLPYHPKYYLHLHCYTPGLKQYIYKKDIEYSSTMSQSKREIVTSWLNKWNENYTPIDEDEIDIPLVNKLAYSEPSKYRRAWLEVLKFLDAKEIALTISHINRDFYIVSCDEELWHFNCSRDFTKLNLRGETYRERYINSWTACFWCHKNPDSSYVLLTTYLCSSCSQLERFEIISKTDIKHYYGINPNVLQLKYGKGRHKSVSFRYMIEDAINVYCQKQKDSLLKEMREGHIKADLIELVENISSRSMIKKTPNLSDISSLTYKQRQLYVMIYDYLRTGKNEAKLKRKLLE